MQRVLWAVLAVALSQPANAERIIDLLTPSPFTVALEIGRWMVKDRETVYQVSVQGAGATEQQAREQAFALAIDEALGSLVISQVDIENHEVKRNRLLKYNSGYIHSFRVKQRFVLPDGQIALELDVWVKKLALSDGLVASATTVDRELAVQASAALQSMNRESQAGNELLAATVEDYPARALTPTVRRTDIAVTADRRARVVIDLAVRWNADYLATLHRVLEQTSQLSSVHDCVHQNHLCNGTVDSTWGITLWQPHDRAARPTGRYGFRDRARFAVAQRLLAPVWVRVAVTDYRGQTMIRQCTSLTDLGGPNLVNGYYNNGMHVNGYVTVESRLAVQQTLSTADLENMAAVQVSLVRSGDC